MRTRSGATTTIATPSPTTTQTSSRGSGTGQGNGIRAPAPAPPAADPPDPGSNPKRRLFIGNLHPDISSDDLKQRFGNFGPVHEVDVRNKNDATFAFLDIIFDDQENGLRKCIDLLNNTKWKGLMMKVQLAKENFIEKLKKERELSRNLRKPRPPDNFDFEIVTSNSRGGPAETKSQAASHATDQKYKQNGTPVSEAIVKPVDKKQDFARVPESPPPPSKSKRSSLSPPKETREKASAYIPLSSKKPDVAHVSSSSSSSESDSSSDSDGGGPAKKKKAKSIQLPMFRGILAYPSLQEIKPTVPQPAAVATTVKTVPAPPAVGSDTKISTPTNAGIKINPLKKQKSDALRVQSLQSRDDLKKTREAIVRQALSNTNLVEQQKNESVSSSSTATAKSKSKEASNDFLFGSGGAASDQEDEDDASQFKIKPQYEGEAGQRLMELSSKFGGDERFRLDKRFAEDQLDSPKPEDDANIESEKQTQMDVLNEMFGPGIMSAPRKSGGELHAKHGGYMQAANAQVAPSPLGLVRYQPSSVEHKMKYEIKVEEHKTSKSEPVPTSSAGKDDPSLPKSKRGRKATETEEPKKSVADAETSVANNHVAEVHKPVYKVASNLKQLFSDGTGLDGEAAPPKFSLLNSFGGGDIPAAKNAAEVGEDEDEQESRLKTKKSGDKSTAFWNTAKPNPFKYDSSDDEEGDDGATSKKKAKSQQEPERKEAVDLTNQLNLFKGESFFYADGDPRLAGVLESFMKSDEDLEAVKRQFNDGGGRTELKMIAKAKWRNSKRKDEKRIKAIRLNRKKKRRDAVKKQEHHEKIRAMREARANQD